MSPMKHPAATPAEAAARGETSCVANSRKTRLATPSIEPTDRSNSPEIISSATPRATMPGIA